MTINESIDAIRARYSAEANAEVWGDIHGLIEALEKAIYQRDDLMFKAYDSPLTYRFASNAILRSNEQIIDILESKLSEVK